MLACRSLASRSGPSVCALSFFFFLFLKEKGLKFQSARSSTSFIFACTFSPAPKVLCF